MQEVITHLHNMLEKTKKNYNKYVIGCKSHVHYEKHLFEHVLQHMQEKILGKHKNKHHGISRTWGAARERKLLSSHAVSTTYKMSIIFRDKWRKRMLKHACNVPWQYWQHAAGWCLPDAAVRALDVALINDWELSVTSTSATEERQTDCDLDTDNRQNNLD